MRYLKNFILFENKMGPLNVDYILDLDTYIDYMAYAKSTLLRANASDDFKLWAITKAYISFLMNTHDNLQHELESSGRIEELESKIKKPLGYNEGKDFEKEIGEDPMIKKFIESIEYEISLDARIIQNFNDKKITSCFEKAIFKMVLPISENIFYPGYMSKLKDLKFLDQFPKRTWATISDIVSKSFNKSIDNYSRLETDPDSLGKKFVSLLKEVSSNDIEFLRNMNFPDKFNQAIVEYFKTAEDSFKVADEIRRGNINVFNKIKEFMPNIDTAADLGDLGF